MNLAVFYHGASVRSKRQNANILLGAYLGNLALPLPLKAKEITKREG